MKVKSKLYIHISLLVLALAILYWKFFALYFLPIGSPIMNMALQYMQSRIAVSWVDFYHGNAMFYESEKNRASDLSGSIQKLDIAIEYYLSSLDVRETREARENLETAQKEYKKLKEEQQIQRQVEQENEKEKKSEEGDKNNTSNSGATSSGTSQNTSSQDNKNDESSKSGTSNDPKENKTSEEGKKDEKKDEKKDGAIGYTNTGTFFEGFSGSMTGTGLSAEDEIKLKDVLNGLKELQNQKGNFTRPKGIPSPDDGMGGLFEKYFGNSSLFGNERDNDPYDY